MPLNLTPDTKLFSSRTRVLLATLLLALSLLSSCLVAQAADGAPKPEKHLYLLQKPVLVEVQLGRAAKVAHHVLPNLTTAIKSALLFAATGEPVSTILYIAYETAKAFPSIRIHSTIDLKIRAWWARRKSLDAIKKLPGVDRVLMLTSTELSYTGLVAHKSLAQSFIFFETSKPLELPSELADEFGAAIEIPDIGSTRVRMHLTIGDDAVHQAWEMPLGEIFGKTPMPDAVASEWSRAITDFSAEQKWVVRHVTKAHYEKIGVKAELLMPDGTEKELGNVMQARSVRKLLGMNAWSQVRDTWHSYWGKPALPKGAFPISVFSCEAALTQP